jgi:CubicO group peptidase (beta-lactamase class C family)
MRRWRTDAVALRFAAAALLFVAAVGDATRAYSDPRPAITGTLSADGLKRVGDYFESEVATGKIPGAVVLIQQHGKPVYFQSFGFRDPVAHAPMTKDAIFRLYSMSKPITSVAVMMLVDDGKIALSDPLSKYIPAFADVKVAVAKKDESGKPALASEPLARPITIEDLLRHTSGLTYGFYGDSPIRKLYAGSDLFAGDFDNARFVERLAKLPLAEQPETLWDYGHSTDVLGCSIPWGCATPAFSCLKPSAIASRNSCPTMVSSVRLPASAIPRIGGAGNPAVPAWMARRATMRALRKCCWKAARLPASAI